jgi:hypothetical protein
MSAGGAAERDDADPGRDERPAQERAEEIVERVAERVARFARRFAARAREEAEDIVAEAQTIRRGGRPGQ